MDVAMRLSLLVIGWIVGSTAACTTEKGVEVAPPPAEGGGSSPIDPGGAGIGVDRPAPDGSVRSTSYSGFGARRRLIVRDQAAWDTVWARFSGSVQPVPQAPTVDFATQM